MAFIDNDRPDIKTEVHHKDYNRSNDSVSNLEWVSHADNVRYSQKNKRDISGENNPNYGNKKLSEIYKKNPELALEKQSRRGSKNGRARPIRAFLDGKLLGEFEYISKCCEFLNSYLGTSCKEGSLRSKIDSSIRLNKPYKGIVFEKQ
jgi:hypothetical protein